MLEPFRHRLRTGYTTPTARHHRNQGQGAEGNANGHGHTIHGNVPAQLTPPVRVRGRVAPNGLAARGRVRTGRAALFCAVSVPRSAPVAPFVELLARTIPVSSARE